MAQKKKVLQNLNANAKKWIAALRSGKYKQGARALTTLGYTKRSKDLDCCLGVACKLYIADGHPLEVIKLSGQVEYDGETTSLPYKVQEWLGLRGESGEFKRVAGRQSILANNSLAALNDDGWSFKKIADFIESRPDGLFVTPRKRGKK